MVNSRWFCVPRPVRQPKLRLFCFPYAGGSAITYYPWAAMLNPEVELVAIQPPGRSNRLNETAYCDMHQMVDSLLDSIVPLLGAPFVFFGHSMGSRIAYELAIRLKARGLPMPMQFFASGSGAPHIAKRKKQVYDLPDDEFINELRRLNGTPEAVLQNREMIQLFLPLLRADFQIADTYIADKIVLNSPIIILAGTEDVGIEPFHLNSWKELTSYPSEVQYILGDHFFIEKNKRQVFDILCEEIEYYMKRNSIVLFTSPIAC